MKNRSGDKAISDILGTMMLLVVVTLVMSVVFNSILSNPDLQIKPLVAIQGRLQGDDIVIEHHGGDTLGLNTKLILSVGGLYEVLIIGDYLDDKSKQDGVWNLGERVVYPSGDFSDIQGLQINVVVVDVESNSAVLSGTLQSGDVILTWGGIWHFDEGNGSIAYDSSGNNNHGTVYGANWTTGVNSTALIFDGLDDYVNLGNPYSLAINDDITVEAWMKPYTWKGLIDNFTLDAAFGYNPNIIRIKEKIYAVVYQGKNDDGFLKTVEITSDGEIHQTANDIWVFDSGKAFEPRIIHGSGGIYVIAYVDQKLDGILKTVEIASNGTINEIMTDMFIFDTNTINEPDIIHVSDDVYAVAYGDKNFGIVQTVEIAPNGSINGTINTFQFTDAKCDDPNIIQCSGDIFVIAYVKNQDQCMVRTIEIASNGTITDPSAALNELQINPDACDDPNIIHISDDVYAVAYSYHGENFGDLVTFEIANDGQINAIIDSLLFDHNKCQDPNIIHAWGNIYLMAYTSNSPHVGQVISVEIAANGQIADTVICEYPYAASVGYEPNITRLSDNVYAVVFRGKTPHIGYVGSIRAGENLISAYVRGISKVGAYGIYSNTTTAFASINDKTISGAISPGWNHIVLTYDVSNIRLYANGSEIASMPYNATINRTANNLLFGHLFYGIIDEVAIYNRALTAAEVLNHYNTLK